MRRGGGFYRRAALFSFAVCSRREGQALSQPSQHEPQPPLFPFFTRRITTKTTAKSRHRAMTILKRFIQVTPKSRPTARTSKAQSQATPHWKTTTNSAHLAPSSRLTEAIAATQGV